MRRFLVAAVAAAAAAVVAPLALAAPAARPLCKPVSIVGKVDSVAARSFVVRVVRGNPAARARAAWSVTLGRGASVQLGTRRAALADLVAGQQVLVVGSACAAVVSAHLVLGHVKPVATSDGDEGALDGGAATTPAPAPAPAAPAPAPGAGDQGVA